MDTVSSPVAPEPAFSPAYQIFMLILCVFALAMTVLETAFALDPEVGRILEYADTFVCVVFLFDFVLSFARVPRKGRYLMTWGWLDLLSSVPQLDFARWGRIARVARLFRVLRALRASRLLTKMLMRKRRQSVALAAAILALFLVVGSSAAILRFEDLPQSNIKTADDAIWWAFATITTIGYGDRFPASTEGRFIAALLMTAGVGLFGAFSAALAAWFLAPEDEATDAEIAELRAEIVALRNAIEERLPRQT
ncbi:MAG: voltage-gated potassium channel [Acidobacteriota bacterium]|jgi:voltage-gated potassium channel|nr:voltage-gated potassium channel [Acidobacteriota bacterium]